MGCAYRLDQAKMRKVCLAAAFLACSVSGVFAMADTSYLCIGELSTGFKQNGDQWVTTTFNVTEDKFAVSVKNDYVTVTRIGNDYPSHQCALAVSDAEGFACGGLGWGFRMLFSTLRYQEYYGIGFVEGADDGKNTPAMTIGRCSPF